MSQAGHEQAAHQPPDAASSPGGGRPPEPGDRLTVPRPGDLPEAERQKATQVLLAEYGVLAGALGAVWSASLVRTSLFLGVLSAVGVALGFAAQAGGGLGSTFVIFALVTLPLALFLGIATFVRLVEIQREAVVYIAGMNRIRYFLSEVAPAARPYLVLSTHDDEAGIYRSQGTGIRLRPPRAIVVFALVQTQGIVAVMCAALGGIVAAFAIAGIAPALAIPAGAVGFGVVLVSLFTYWNRSIREIEGAIRPINPTPPDGAPPTI